MMDWKEFFNDFADRYYSVPDFTNEEHVYALQNYLIEQGMLVEDVDFAIKTLLGEAPDKPTNPKIAQQAKKMGLVWKRNGYGPENKKGITHKVDDDKLVPVDDKKDDDKDKKGKEDDKKPMNLSKGGKVDAQLGGDRDASPTDMMDKDDVGKVKDKDDEGRNISSDNQKIIDDFKTRINDRMDGLSKKQKQLVKDGQEKISVIYDEDATDEQKKEAAQWLVDNLGFSTNANGKKAYFNRLGGNRKIISGEAGTEKSKNLVDKVKELLGGLKTFDAKGVKQGFTTAAKPDLGDENIVKPKDDKQVANYFAKHPVLQKVRGGLHGIFGVKDEKGKIKMPSSQHSKEYLAQSFNNPALQNTIDHAQRMVDEGKVDKGVLKALEEHQKRLQNVLENVEIPSEKAQKAIADSYNDLMVGLHKADGDIANSIMKQLAENNLYEQELANGEEVYLPSAGNFPAGDKIKGGTTERVSLISCKFGKAGRVYGCPANSKTICELHQDKSKRNNQGQYLGEEGHTLVINDDLIRGKNKEQTKEKTKDFIKKSLTEVGLQNTFSDEELGEISNVTADYMDEIDNIKKELSKMKFPDEASKWKEFGKRVAAIENDFKKRLGKVVSLEQAAALIGENNAKNLVQSGGVKPEALMSAIEIANNIRTNESLNDLEHNKQFYDEDGEPRFETSRGTQNPDDYSITFRTKRTAGRTGGGCQLSFTGDGKPAPTELADDGSAIDVETGKVKEV